MADRDQFADVATEVIGEVDHCVVLDIGSRADGNFVDVAAEGGIVPDAGFLVDRDAADHIGTGGDEGAFVDLGVKVCDGFDGHGFLMDQALLRVVSSVTACCHVLRNLSVVVL